MTASWKIGLGLACIASPVLAGNAHLGRLHISNAWARETAATQVVGGGFMAIRNSGRQADTLIGASTPAAAEVQLHTMEMVGGVMRMRLVTGGIPIPAGATVDLKPGSLHIMFMGLKKQLKRGGSIPVMLRFQRAGRVTVQFDVRNITATGMEGHGHVGH